jgi:glycosyltransferase involved in cell wall biosynthesis
VKIAYIFNSIIPSQTANSIHVMKMCQAFANNGHTVVLLVPNRKKDMKMGVSDIYQYYGVRSVFEIIYIHWSKIKGRGYIFSFLAAKTAKRLNSDLVFSRSAAGSYFSACNGLKVVFESHAPADRKLPKYIFEKLIRHPKFKRLIVITNFLKDYYENRYAFLKGRIKAVPDGADPISESLEPVVLPNKGIRLQVGYVGHLYPGKGMEVISLLAPRCPWADFHIVGGMDADLMFWKEKCKDISNLIFHGSVPHKEVGAFEKSFDIALLPNQEKVTVMGVGNIGPWTSPLKLFEYMAAKKPILASDLPVLREILTDGENALLAPLHDIDAWVRNLKRLQADTGLAQRIATNAYNEFIEKYTWKARAETVLSAMDI